MNPAVLMVIGCRAEIFITYARLMDDIQANTTVENAKRLEHHMAEFEWRARQYDPTFRVVRSRRTP